MRWQDWNPGWQNNHQTLEEVLKTLPGVPQEEISWLVRLIENPASPFALPGAVTLKRHDAVHVLLGRGLLNQDEAFVIGFTMGCAHNMNKFHQYLFQTAAAKLYPKRYRFNHHHLRVYEFALQAGKESGISNLHEQPIEEWQQKTLGAIREKLGLTASLLASIYEQEKTLLPHTKASLRL
jgi:hypothetical protein